jgi:hypothetical protein
VAADRRSRRRPLGSATKTVGELEDEGTTAGGTAALDEVAVGGETADGDPADAEGPVRQ